MAKNIYQVKNKAKSPSAIAKETDMEYNNQVGINKIFINGGH